MVDVAAIFCSLARCEGGRRIPIDTAQAPYYRERHAERFVTEPRAFSRANSGKPARGNQVSKENSR